MQNSQIKGCLLELALRGEFLLVNTFPYKNSFRLHEEGYPTWKNLAIDEAKSISPSKAGNFSYKCSKEGYRFE